MKDRGWITQWVGIVVNVSVVLGIILVIVELRQNKTLVLSQTRHELATSIVEELGRVAENPQLAAVMRRGDAGDSLDIDEHYQYSARTRALFRYWENVDYQFRLGVYDGDEFVAHRRAWQGYLASSVGAAAAWCAMRPEFSDALRARVDSLVAPGSC